jgi:hypothetical protein
VGPRASLDAEVRRKILCPCQGWNPGPVRNQTLLTELPRLLYLKVLRKKVFEFKGLGDKVIKHTYDQKIRHFNLVSFHSLVIL